MCNSLNILGLVHKYLLDIERLFVKEMITKAAVWSSNASEQILLKGVCPIRTIQHPVRTIKEWHSTGKRKTGV